MAPETAAKRKAEMAFFKDAQTFYDAALDRCGNIRASLSQLKKRLAKSGKRLPSAKWARLHAALMSGEILIGKRGTPGDWAAREARLLKAPLP